VDVLSSRKGVRLGLVVEGEGGRLGLVLVVILPVAMARRGRVHTSPSVPEFRTRHARNKPH
jgi:hypothetical protein